jgi:hypothetical protein
VDFKSDKRADIAAAVAKTKSGSTRLYRVSASSVVGDHGTFISATNPRTDASVAKLNVLVLLQKALKVSLRQIQVYDSRKNVVLSSRDKFDPDAIRDHINWVWERQTNISFSLGKTDAAGDVFLAPGAEGPSRINDAGPRAQRLRHPFDNLFRPQGVRSPREFPYNLPIRQEWDHDR